MGTNPKIRRYKSKHYNRYQIWSVDDRIVAGCLFWQKDEDGNVWSYHDDYQLSSEEMDEIENHAKSLGVITHFSESGGEWRFNGRSCVADEGDVPISIRKECPYCELILRKESWKYMLDDDDYCPLDFDSALEDRPRLD